MAIPAVPLTGMAATTVFVAMSMTEMMEVLLIGHVGSGSVWRDGYLEKDLRPTEIVATMVLVIVSMTETVLLP